MNRHASWKKALAQSPFEQPRFTDRLKQEIMRKTKDRQRTYFHRFRIAITFAVLLISGAVIVKLVSAPSAPANVNTSTEVRTEYREGENVLFQVFPGGPEVTAGKRPGYIIRFTEPFDQFEGKKLGIEAFHLDSGQQVTAVVPETVTEPIPGYTSLQRYTANFALPLSGKWRFEVRLDERFYGDFVLDVKEEPFPWKASPTFELPYVGNDGQSHKYVFAGKEGKVGFLVGPFMNEKGEILDRQPMVAGKPNKYMWHFWGGTEELAGEFRVQAVKEGANREIGIFSASSLWGPNNGADAHIPSSMVLPEAGMWRLNAYINNKLFGSIYVKVDPE